MIQKRVMLIANKWWEADPLCWVLFHDKARPSVFCDYKTKNYPSQRVPNQPTEPRPRDPAAIPRFTFKCMGVTVEVWCLEELMNPAENPSSAAEKARVLPAAIASGTTPDLVIAFGTAGSRPGLHINGCVVVGRRVYIHDAYNGVADRTGLWTPSKEDLVIESDLPVGVIQGISPESKHSAEARLLPPPIDPANPLLVMAGDGFISLGHVNCTNYDEYAWSPQRAVESFNDNASGSGEIGSVESTHGLIRLVSEAPFLYVSGIADPVGLFNLQVTPRVYAQNTAAAHNAAIALAWLLPDVIAALPE
ncbi:MAG: hypothetical protein P8Y03_20225 [Anaerolineales bacterium]|jgi:hypothetical protein